MLLDIRLYRASFKHTTEMKRNKIVVSPLSQSVVALVCIAVFASLAEGVLGSFLPEVSLLTRVMRGVGVAIALGVLHVSMQAALPRYKKGDVKRYLTLFSLLTFSIACVAVVKIVLLALVHYGNAHMAKSDITEISLTFALPFVVAVIVMQSIEGFQLGIITALFGAIVFGVYNPSEGLTGLMVLTSSLVATLVCTQIRSRASYMQAALWISWAMIPFAAVSLFLVPPSGAVDGIARFVGCVISGGLSGLLAVAVTPIVEYFGEYASDMRLIEMATLDHPLLKELSVQAPGTWNHSMVIGMMIESAADAIGANPVVCRVGAYFHDIGKTTKPVYFAENQTPGDNRHDKLSPSMSALIIRSHVKDGVELARKHKLPKIIEDMIPQHHGTSVIDYFYDKARKEAEELGHVADSVDRALYQYPGPKPQTREAGLLMLADGIEAAARTLSDPSHDRIQGMVQKMLNKVFASGELNECDLTLQDLHMIAKCFTRVLSGIYHQRVAYAEPAEKVNHISEGRNVSGDREARDQQPVENLKRLGLE